MKAKFTISLLLIFGASVYLFVGWSEVYTSIEKSAIIRGAAAGISDTLPPGNQTEPFLMGAMESGIDTGFQNLDDAGFNLWHLYSAGNSGWYHAGVLNDSLYAPIEAYRSGVQNKLHDISDHGMKSILHRPKIAMLCYGQRSDYQCDSIPLNDDLWFFSFHSPNHVGFDTNLMTVLTLGFTVLMNSDLMYGINI